MSSDDPNESFVRSKQPTTTGSGAAHAGRQTVRRRRFLSTVYCLVLLSATLGAFALAEAAKNQLSPIYGTKVDKIFSPICQATACHRRARIVFKLRRSARLQIWVDRNGAPVRTLLSERTHRRGTVRVAFAGTKPNGRRLPDGVYQPVVKIDNREFILPNEIRLITKPPRIVHVGHLHTHISPDGDGRNDALFVHYAVNEPAHAILLVDGHQVELTRKQPRRGVLEWNGQIRLRLQPPGRYRIAIAAQDAAGNRSKPLPLGIVTIRYISVSPKRIILRPGQRFAIRIATDAATIRWALNRARGATRSHTLSLRAPLTRGTFRVRLTAVDHTATTTVLVRTDANHSCAKRKQEAFRVKSAGHTRTALGCRR